MYFHAKWRLLFIKHRNFLLIPELTINIVYFSFFSKEKEKLMGEIQKRAHLLKKQQEAQSALKSKIKVS